MCFFKTFLKDTLLTTKVKYPPQSVSLCEHSLSHSGHLKLNPSVPHWSQHFIQHYVCLSLKASCWSSLCMFLPLIKPKHTHLSHPLSYLSLL